LRLDPVGRLFGRLTTKSIERGEFLSVKTLHPCRFRMSRQKVPGPRLEALRKRLD
jgi:hypothetical protein